MAGMSNSEYARHKAKQDKQGTLIWRVLGVAAVIVLVPSLVIPLIGLMFIYGLLASLITEGIIKEDRY